MDELIAQAERVARYDVPIDPRKVLKECASALRSAQERERKLREALESIARLKGLHADDVVSTAIDLAVRALGEEKST